jgi:predicted P-loop ATPase
MHSSAPSAGTISPAQKVNGAATPIPPLATFDPAAVLAYPPSTKGRLALECNARAVPHQSERNASTVLLYDPAIDVWYDEFRGRIMVNGQEQTDEIDTLVTIRMQTHYDMPTIKTGTVAKAIAYVAAMDRRNEVTAWLDSLEWDGVPRIDEMFATYFGAPDNIYTRAAGRNFMIALCARARQPGCKVDNMPVLEGGQGVGKQRILVALAGEQWYGEAISAVDSKDFLMELEGRWIVEIAEMDSIAKSSINAVKRVLSTRTDNYRRPYDRHPKKSPRRAVLVGTTNDKNWGADETGEQRRFWPIAVGRRLDVDGVAAVREQLFAEADQLYREGAKWWLMPDAETRAEQRARLDAHPWLGTIEEYLAGAGNQFVAETDPRDEVTVDEILRDAVGKMRKDWTRRDQRDAVSCLRILGFQQSNTSRGGRSVRIWRRAENIG